ncbi:hypothetical protein [Bradyrhizobium sp.]|uniref:hypothetical protein n=1 Tax=Bradyrhizobium sp. TaxID=376 RepID=UPI0025BE88D7|nr:hypothetical protein [Bradyrhizobium sp.]
MNHDSIEQIEKAIAVLMDDSLPKDARALVAEVLIADIQQRFGLPAARLDTDAGIVGRKHLS